MVAVVLSGVMGYLGLSVSALSTSRSLDAICGPDRTACPASAQDAIDRTRAYALAADANNPGQQVLMENDQRYGNNVLAHNVKTSFLEELLEAFPEDGMIIG